jgi:uncharacterized protein (TIGR03083 family)
VEPEASDLDASLVPQDVPQADHFCFLFDPGVTLTALAGQRRRFGSTAATFTADELASPSRCEEWTVADVLRHLVWVDATMRRIWSGDESPATGFDPRTTPNEWVQADRAVSDEEIRERYLSSTEKMIDELESADPRRYGRPSLSPLGRVPLWMSAVHLGWDSAVHERDVLVPLGRPVEVVPGEIVPSLAYSLALTSFFCGNDPLSVQIGTIRLRRGDGCVTVWASVTDPDKDIGNYIPNEQVTVLTGGPVGTIDALCGRGSLGDTLSGDQAVIDRLGGLARYFTSMG